MLSSPRDKWKKFNIIRIKKFTFTPPGLPPHPLACRSDSVVEGSLEKKRMVSRSILPLAAISYRLPGVLTTSSG